MIKYITEIFRANERQNFQSILVKMTSSAAKYALIALSFFIVTAATGQTIANCRNPEGYAFYHYSGIVNERQAGFTKDEISGGITKIEKLSDGTFDILLIDVRKRIISLTQDGGKIYLLRRGRQDATFIHLHPGMVIEIYTIWTDKEGSHRFDLIQSKGGDNMLIHKSSVMTGTCDVINFTLLD